MRCACGEGEHMMRCACVGCACVWCVCVGRAGGGSFSPGVCGAAGALEVAYLEVLLPHLSVQLPRLLERLPRPVRARAAGARSESDAEA